MPSRTLLFNGTSLTSTQIVFMKKLPLLFLHIFSNADFIIMHFDQLTSESKLTDDGREGKTLSIMLNGLLGPSTNWPQPWDALSIHFYACSTVCFPMPKRMDAFLSSFRAHSNAYTIELKVVGCNLACEGTKVLSMSSRYWIFAFRDHEARKSRLDQFNLIELSSEIGQQT